MCGVHGNGMSVIKKGVMERMVKKTEKADVILDEDLDHFYLNGVDIQENGKRVSKNAVAFWNCNGWGGELHTGKERTLAEMAATEGVDMICLTDTRLDNFIGLHVVAKTTNELKKHTGKTWHGRPISRRENGKSGGAVILYSSDWTGVRIVERVKYGVCTEIVGKWKGVKYTIIAAYRPCNNDNEG